MQQGDPTQATQVVAALARPLVVDRRLGLPDRVALDLLVAADSEDQRGQPAAASDLLGRALAVYTAIGDARNAEAVRHRLAARPAANGGTAPVVKSAVAAQ